MEHKLATSKFIFINGDIVEQVLSYIIQCQQKPSLVLHNSDRFFDRIRLEAVKPYVDKIYTINCDFVHPKIVHIPLGVSDQSVIYGNKRVKRKRRYYVMSILGYIRIQMN